MALPKFDCDYHIHSVFSGHSAMDMLVGNIIRAADEHHLQRIMLLEHVPQIDPAVQDKILNNEYTTGQTQRLQIDAILEERDLWRNRCKVETLVGAEIDANPNTLDGSLLLNDLHGIDLVLASTHFLPGSLGLWYDKQEWSQEVKEKIYRNWFVWVIHICANPKVDILAHPGASLAATGAITEFSGQVLEDFDKLFKVCKKFSTAIELNELLQHKLNEQQRDSYYKVIQAAITNKVKISLGSDAHQLGDVGKFKWVKEVAEKAVLSAEDLFVPIISKS